MQAHIFSYAGLILGTMSLFEGRGHSPVVAGTYSHYVPSWRSLSTCVCLSIVLLQGINLLISGYAGILFNIR